MKDIDPYGGQARNPAGGGAQRELGRLADEAFKFETLANRPMIVSYMDTGTVVYASLMVDHYLGFDHRKVLAEGKAYYHQVVVKEQHDWLAAVDQMRREVHARFRAQGARPDPASYTYDMEVENPATRLRHKLIVRSSCLDLVQGAPLFLATTFFDVSALKRSRRLFFHTHSDTETTYKDLDLNTMKKASPLITETEAELIRLLRVLPPVQAAQRLGVKPGTVQARLKALCRRTDSIGLHGLVQVCDAMGWC